MKTYTARSGEKQYKPSIAEARKYRCEACGELKVYGAEELALMGLVY